jgi:Na+/H+ antiporter NhaC
MLALLPIVAAALLVTAAESGVDPILADRPRFRIEIPGHVLTDVPVRRIVIHALDAEGKIDAAYHEQPLITGIRLATSDSDDTKLGTFQNGVFELTTDLAAGRRVYVSAPEIVVDPGARGSGRLAVDRTHRWLCLVPSLVAFVLCLWPRNFILAMFTAVFCGTAILVRGNFFAAFVGTIDNLAVGDLGHRQADETAHIMLLTAMLFFGALFAVMSVSGGLAALAERLGRVASTRQRGQLMVLASGLLVFFDDYAHTLIVGKTLRPLSDRLKISREKLAFLVDATAAPVAALAVFSTWIALERSPIRGTIAHLGLRESSTAVFIASLPYCFYPLLMIVFAAFTVFSGRDFGPMLGAEWRAAVEGHLNRAGTFDPLASFASESDPPTRRVLISNAGIPLLALFGLIGIGLWWTGRDALAAAKGPQSLAGPGDLGRWLLDILEHSNPLRVLLFSSFVASGAAVACAVWSGALILQEGLHAWVTGVQRMVPAVLILALSWSFARVCDEDHLNVAGFLMEICQLGVTVEWIPLVAFGVVGLTSFVVGNAWAALPVALPLFISVTYGLLVDLNEASPTHPLLLATIGAVIAGTVFGRHSSPICDTTVLSSASSACSHLEHVFTQFPYAMTVAVISAIFGYFPVALGYSPVLLLPLCAGILFAIIQLGGRPAVDDAGVNPALAERQEGDSNLESRQAGSSSAPRPATQRESLESARPR